MLIICVAVLLLAGTTLLTIGLRAQQHAPQPPPSAAGAYAAGDRPVRAGAHRSAHPSSTSIAGGATGPVLGKSAPRQLRIPAIGVTSTLLRLGLNADRTLQVPPLGAHSQAGWYRYSPTPGQLGPSVLVGHIDSARYGPGVFFRLGALRRGDTVLVRRADHTVAVFRVDAVARYPKNRFPTRLVYGNTNHAALRLITCGGSFDDATGSYRDNIVAFASLVSSHRG